MFVLILLQDLRNGLRSVSVGDRFVIATGTGAISWILALAPSDSVPDCTRLTTDVSAAMP
ncbi:MAG: hypothetical protein AAFX80_07260 [Cyanobacteria bacterium J06639_18]